MKKTELDPYEKKMLSGKDCHFVLREGKKITFCLITKPKYASVMECKFRSESQAKIVEEWYHKKFKEKSKKVKKK